ncbi:MAG: F0F1 ATP synthase subunit gamma, partial [Prolixibacteraceae bacterium]|nr:F0F1 ATP synthase subunit gamma [Prolixibacteraceae bacterium]
MSGLKDIRTRIASVKTTRQVTNAMKMVSAAKLKKAQDAILHFRPYAQKLHDILDHLIISLDSNIDSPFCKMREPRKILIVAIASNRGLCGSFNLNIAKQTVELISRKYGKQNKAGNVQVMVVGKQCEQMLKSMGVAPAAEKNDIWQDFNYGKTEKIAEEIMDGFIAGNYDCVELVFNEFSSAAKQITTCMKYLPVVIPIEKEKPLQHHDIMI